MKKILLIFLYLLSFFTVYAQDAATRTILGIDHAKQELADVLNNNSREHILVEKVIKDKETAISVAEAILFKIYGKENIIKQRPYESYLINNYWVLIGTLPITWDGGTFFIIINATDARVIKLTHGK